MSSAGKTDRNFDGKAAHFARNIYASPKGKIRLEVLWRHLLQSLPSLQEQTPMTVLDAGCGMGQLASRLLGLGHHLKLCDISAEMLGMARELLEREQGQALAEGRVSLHQAALQDMSKQDPQRFDLVLCHAVLEWLAEPRQAIADLAALVTLGGHLSLTFYNRDALIYRNLLNGNLRKVKSGDYAGHPGGLTPSHPLHPPEVFAWLEEQGFDIQATAGLRVFYDFIPRKTRERLPLADIIELELEYSQRQPFQALARYIHVLAVRR